MTNKLINNILEKLIIRRGSKKCFIFDLDGTIVFNNQYLVAENENMLKQIISAGHEVIFATGRPVRDFKAVMPSWCHSLPATLFSGGVSMNNNDIVRNCPVERHHVTNIVELCKVNNYRFVLDNLMHYYHPDLPDMPLGIINNVASTYRINKLEHILDSEIYKILIFEMSSHEFFIEYAKEQGLIIKHHSYDNCFDVVPSTCNKYLGVLPFITAYANEDIFVFGNDFNDLELFNHFNNSVLFGEIPQLKKLVKLNIPYDRYMQQTFFDIINIILEIS